MAYVTYKGTQIVFIKEDEHAELMKHWDENPVPANKLKLPAEKSKDGCYICKIHDGDNSYYWDCIQISGMEAFGASFRHLKNAEKWFVGEYESEEDLLEGDWL